MHAVMNFVVGENPGVYLPDGRCDIAKVIAMMKEALEVRDGQALYSEDDFREMVEFTQQTRQVATRAAELCSASVRRSGRRAGHGRLHGRGDGKAVRADE